MKNNHKITVYTNYEEYRKYCLVKDEIEKKLELITNVNIHTDYRKEYQPEGMIPSFGVIKIVGNTTEENANYIKNIVDEINQLISSQ